jgi:hypothetical protein
MNPLLPAMARHFGPAIGLLLALLSFVPPSSTVGVPNPGVELPLGLDAGLGNGLPGTAVAFQVTPAGSRRALGMPQAVRSHACAPLVPRESGVRTAGRS